MKMSFFRLPIVLAGIILSCGATLSFSQPVEWVWKSSIDTPALAGMRCLKGETAGIGVHTVGPRMEVEDLLVFFDGGGSCVSGEDCDDNPPANVTYDASKFASEEIVLRSPYLRKSNPTAWTIANPFADMNKIFVPYCTGDAHTGDNVLAEGASTYNFVGRSNFDKVIDYIQAYYSPKTVWLMGASAGGVGANYNYVNLRARLNSGSKKVTVHLIEDSSPGLPRTQPYKDSGLTFDQVARTNWAYVNPCSGCDNPQATRLHIRQNYDVRYAFLTFSKDLVTMDPDQYGGTYETNRATVNDYMEAMGTAANGDKTHTMYMNNSSPALTCGPASTHVVSKKNYPDALRDAHMAFMRDFVQLAPTADIDDVFTVTACAKSLPYPF